MRRIDEFCNASLSWNTVKAYVPIGDFGSYPDKRSVPELIKTSIINLDKPPGPTSHEVAFWIKNMFNLPRVGHGGTLELL
ncbi:MAG: tRNA pseudouridine synthase A [Metallosphaera sp.]